MLLIVKDPHLVYVIDDIRLDEGYLPAVGDFHPVWAQDGLPQIEPALWFKTDVVTCVLLDIYQRSITWSNQPITEDLSKHLQSCDPDLVSVAMETLGTKSNFDAETMDLDASYDEMFEAGEYLLNLQHLMNTVAKMSKKERKRASVPDKSTINKIIIKLLHCYLLPCLKMKPVQLTSVKKTLKKQEDLIAKIDEKLEFKMNEVSCTKIALQKKRVTMVEEFQTFNQVVTYPKEILLVMEAQFQEDIRNMNSELDRVQDEVNVLKAAVNADIECLAAKRAERDDVLGRQIKFLMARENIINAVALEKPQRKNSSFYQTFYVHDEGEFVVCEMGKYDMQSALWMYSKVYEVLQSQREERAVLISRKNLMISVREAVRETVVALENGEVTTGSSNNKTRSRRATDVLNSTVPDQWLTLTEKVCECLTTNTEHKNRHSRFVAQIQDKLAAAISVAKLAYRETTDTALRLQRRRQSHYLVRREIQSAIMANQEDYREVKLEVATLLRTRANSCKKFRHRMDSIIQMNEPKDSEDDENELIQEQIKNEIRLIHARIHAHFDMMSSELQIELKEQTDVAYYKIWLCYEVHFYDDVMKNLIKLYHLSYKLICSNLRRNAANVEFKDLHVQEDWLQELLFRQKPDLSSDSDSSDSDDSALDLDDVKVKMQDDDEDAVELRDKNRLYSDVTSSSESDLENLNSIVKRLSIVYGSASQKGSSYESASSLPDSRHFGERSLDNVQEDDHDRDEVSKENAVNVGESLSPTEAELKLKTTADLRSRELLPINEEIVDDASDQNKIQGSDTSSQFIARRIGIDEREGKPSEQITAEEGVGLAEGTDDLTMLQNHSDQEEPSSPIRIGGSSSILRHERFQMTKHNTLPRSMKPPRCVPAHRSDAFRELFHVPMTTVLVVLEEETPLKKLQLMTKVVRQIQKAVTTYHEEKRKKKDGIEIIDDDDESMMCCDDFLSILTLILLHLDPRSLANLYPHVVMLTDMMAPFLSSGLHSNSLTHFYGAYQIIFSTMVVKNAMDAKMSF